jgi:hypothetical protein
VAADILIFDFELFIGARSQKERRADNFIKCQLFNNIGPLISF